MVSNTPRDSHSVGASIPSRTRDPGNPFPRSILPFCVLALTPSCGTPADLSLRDIAGDVALALIAQPSHTANLRARRTDATSENPRPAHGRSIYDIWSDQAGLPTTAKQCPSHRIRRPPTGPRSEFQSFSLLDPLKTRAARFRSQIPPPNKHSHDSNFSRYLPFQRLVLRVSPTSAQDPRAYPSADPSRSFPFVLNTAAIAGPPQSPVCPALLRRRTPLPSYSASPSATRWRLSFDVAQCRKKSILPRCRSTRAWQQAVPRFQRFCSRPCLHPPPCPFPRPRA